VHIFFHAYCIWITRNTTTVAIALIERPSVVPRKQLPRHAICHDSHEISHVYRTVVSFSLSLSFSLFLFQHWVLLLRVFSNHREREREKSLREKDRKDFSTQTPLPTWLFFKSNHHLEKILCLHSFYPARDGSFLLSSLGRSYRVARPISKCKLHLENFETVKVKRNQVRENKYEWELCVGN